MKYKNNRNRARRLHEALLVGPTGSYKSQNLKESEAKFIDVEDVFDVDILNEAFYGVVDFLRSCTNECLETMDEVSLDDIFNSAWKRLSTEFVENPFEGLGDFVLNRLMNLITDLDTLEELLNNF